MICAPPSLNWNNCEEEYEITEDIWFDLEAQEYWVIDIPNQKINSENRYKKFINIYLKYWINKY
uniref:Uncharacterized protein n=1 Tax=viral metagenome TaxID=1070528 RepID=A0A6C0C465_9ZZZZ